MICDRYTYTARMRFVVLAVASCLTFGCEQSLPIAKYEFGGATMGTTFSATIVGVPENDSLDALQARIRQALDDIEETTSTYREESELSRFNNTASTGWISVSERLCAMVAEAQILSRKTNGAFDITVGPVVNLWGFGPGGDRMQPPDQAEIEALADRVGVDKLAADCSVPALRKSHPLVYVDLSGWAKGYAADELADILIASGIGNFLVEVGGELRVQGSNANGKPWAVAIEKPVRDRREVHSVLNISDTGLATSGDYRNYFEHAGLTYSHTIDPRSGRPITHQLASVTVLHESAATADGLATALLVLGPEEGPALAAELGIEAIFLVRTPDGLKTTSTTSKRRVN